MIGRAKLFQIVGILFGDITRRLLTEGFVAAGFLQERGQNAQMRDLQNVGIGNGSKALGRQGDYLKQIIQIDIADALQTGLQDFAEAVGAGGYPVNVFVVIQLLLKTGDILAVFHDGQGNVGLESQKLTVGIVEGDHSIADKELLVLQIEIVFLEFIHLKGQVTVRSVQLPQSKQGFFFLLEHCVTHVSCSPPPKR